MPPPKMESEESEESMEEEEEENEEPNLQKDSSANVLFGEAYEQQFIELLENEDFGDLEFDQKLLEKSLNMPIEELRELKKIQIQVDTTNSHLQTVGETLCSLTELNLNDSIIASIRDLGTAFRNVEILQISRCELKDLSGLIALDKLKELYCSYNEISDIYDISYLEDLEVLDLEANKITEFKSLQVLTRNTKLIDLSLAWNPVAQEFNFRKRVTRILEQIKYLDGVNVKSILNEKKRTASIDEIQKVEDEDLKTDVMRMFLHLIPDEEELKKLADEALDNFSKEANDENLIINAIKSSEYKKYAFERGPLEYTEDDGRKLGMSKTCGSGFFPMPEKEGSEEDTKVVAVKDDQSMDTVF